ncbi:hypothetical protein YC2023_082662 [Brassica napus]
MQRMLQVKRHELGIPDPPTHSTEEEVELERIADVSSSKLFDNVLNRYLCSQRDLLLCVNGQHLDQIFKAALKSQINSNHPLLNRKNHPLIGSHL